MSILLLFLGLSLVCRFRIIFSVFVRGEGHQNRFPRFLFYPTREDLASLDMVRNCDVVLLGEALFTTIAGITENSCPDSDHWDTNFRQGSLRGRQAGRQKYVMCLADTTGRLVLTMCWLDARHSPQGMLGSDIAGLKDASSSSITDQLTRQHRMTLDEAHLILNVKRGESLEVVQTVRPVVDIVDCKWLRLTVRSITSIFSRRIRHRLRLPSRQRVGSRLRRHHILTTCNQKLFEHGNESTLSMLQRRKAQRRPHHDHQRTLECIDRPTTVQLLFYATFF